MLSLLFVVFAATSAYLHPPSPLYQVLQQLPSYVPAGACKTALLDYVDSLDRGVPWALKLYDASVKYPDGILASNGYSLGNFEECIAVQDGSYSGKYCLVDVHYQFRNSSQSRSRFQVPRDKAHIAVCIPSVCTARALEGSLQRVSQSARATAILPNVKLRVALSEEQCSQAKSDVNEEDVWMRYIGMILLGIFAYCTWQGSCSGIASCFSISKHWAKLFEGPADDNYIACIHGLRVLAIFTVVIGHRAEAIAGAPLHNPQYLEKMFENPLNVFVLNGTVVVDLFFTVAGFLLCWKMLEAAQCGYIPSLWDIVRRRYLRLTPAYLGAMLIQGWMLEGLGSGPLWPIRVGREAQYCRQHWWVNLLYINNFYKPAQICIDPSWYLAVDMQLLILTPVVIRPLLTWTKYRFVPLLLACTAAFWIPFFVTLYNGLDPTVIPDLTTVVRAAEDRTNQLLYITTYCRAGPYLVGIATAYLLYTVKSRHFYVSQRVWSAGWYAALTCMVGSVGLGYPFFTSLEVPPVLTALYAASFRTIFSLGIAYIILAGASNRGGWLSSASMLPLSKISYSVYLTHSLWIQLSYSWFRSPVYVTDLFQMGIILSDLIVCTALGIAFYLLVERPSSELISMFVLKTIQPRAEILKRSEF